MLDIGVIGTGGIGSNLVDRVTDGAVPDARVTGVYNRTPERAREVVAAADATDEIAVVSGPLDLCDRADVVVEAASQQVVEQHAVDVVATGTDLVALSVGAFRDADLLAAVRTAADENDARVRVPSGAIAGLDGVGAVGNGPTEAVELVCHRPPSYLEPYVDDVDRLYDLPDGAAVFDGTAAEAAAAFPSHMNVAIALTLTARVDPSDVSVHIEVQREAPRSRYLVRAHGEAGSVEVEVENYRTPTEPETSSLIVNSAVETLRRLRNGVVVGT